MTNSTFRQNGFDHVLHGYELHQPTQIGYAIQYMKFNSASTFMNLTDCLIEKNPFGLVIVDGIEQIQIRNSQMSHNGHGLHISATQSEIWNTIIDCNQVGILYKGDDIQVPGVNNNIQVHEIHNCLIHSNQMGIIMYDDTMNSTISNCSFHSNYNTGIQYLDGDTSTIQSTSFLYNTIGINVQLYKLGKGDLLFNTATIETLNITLYQNHIAYHVNTTCPSSACSSSPSSSLDSNNVTVTMNYTTFLENDYGIVGDVTTLINSNFINSTIYHINYTTSDNRFNPIWNIPNLYWGINPDIPTIYSMIHVADPVLVDGSVVTIEPVAMTPYEGWDFVPPTFFLGIDLEKDIHTVMGPPTTTNTMAMTIIPATSATTTSPPPTQVAVDSAANPTMDPFLSSPSPSSHNSNDDNELEVVVDGSTTPKASQRHGNNSNEVTDGFAIAFYVSLTANLLLSMIVVTLVRQLHMRRRDDDDTTPWHKNNNSNEF